MASRFRTIAGRALVSTVLSVLAVPVAWAQAVHVTDDTNINLASPTQVNGTATTLLVRNVGSGGERHTFLRFNGATLPTGQIVTKATLRLFVTAVNDPGRIDVYSVAGPWTEETLTAAAAPARGPLVGTITVTVADTSRFVVLDVTSVVQAWLAGTLANGGLVLVPSTVDPVRVTLDSKESLDTSQPPELEVAMISTADITAVNTGLGLTGGGTAGDVTVALDTPFTDARYAASTHGHTVGQVTGAATLGANVFAGNQTVNGTVGVSGAVNAGTLRAVSALSTPVTGQSTTSSPAFGVIGSTASTNGGAAGVYGVATAASGSGSVHGVLGEATGAVGAAVRGLARHQFGVAFNGITEGTSGTGVVAEASANSGNTTGLLASVNSPTGTSATFQGVGGDLLLGLRSGIKFRVDGTGAVYASSYRDLARNPIASGSGDITSVGAATGLTGGGGTGDVSLGLDTAFTDGRYATLAHGHDVSQVANAARLGTNTFTGTQTIGTGDLNLTTGSILKSGSVFLHASGTNNTFAGASAGSGANTGFGKNSAFGGSALTSLTDGADNTAVGFAAMASNGSGNSNTAVGVNALRFNTGGGGNTTSGHFSMQSNTTGDSNTASGYFALVNNTTGSGNTALGQSALSANVIGAGNTAIGLAALQGNTGGNNVAVGRQAGRDGTNGANNIYLGADVIGVAGESNTMYLGKQGTQTATYVAGIRGTTVTGGEVVMIDGAGRLGSGAVTVGGDSVGSTQVIDESLTAADLAPGSVAGSELAAGSVTADKVAFGYASSAAPGGPALDVACVGCIAASEVAFGFAGAGANTFTGTQTIDSGNLDLDASTAAGGNVTKNGASFLHNPGIANTFLGVTAGNSDLTGANNTAVGHQALNGLTTATGNTAVGNQAMFFTTTGPSNTAVGGSALVSNTTGNGNTAVGGAALASNTVGIQNLGLGGNALVQSTGNRNIGIGQSAGANLTSGSNNIYLGSLQFGTASESNTMYLGSTQTRTLIAGVRSITTVNPDAIPVVIDSSGQLGTISSSRRFKEDIHDMADISRRLLQLRPVTFRYTQAFGNGTKPVQFGLIAEEVAETFPELAVRNAQGDVETVHYETLNVLLLNELQRMHREMADQRERLQTLERLVDGLAAARVAEVAPPR